MGEGDEKGTVKSQTSEDGRGKRPRTEEKTGGRCREEKRGSLRSGEKKASRRRRRKRICLEIERGLNRLGEGCEQLLKELDELGEEFEADYLRRHWFTGVTFYLAPPIHSNNPDTQTIAWCTLRRLLMCAKSLGAESSETVDESVTHIVTMRKPGQILPTVNILRSLGMHDTEHLFSYGKLRYPGHEPIKVIYNEWISDSLEAGEIKDVGPYLAVK